MRAEDRPVIGAGPGGPKVARVEAARGFDVTVLERAGRVGGQMHDHAAVKGRRIGWSTSPGWTRAAPAGRDDPAGHGGGPRDGRGRREEADRRRRRADGAAARGARSRFPRWPTSTSRGAITIRLRASTSTTPKGGSAARGSPRGSRWSRTPRPSPSPSPTTRRASASSRPRGPRSSDGRRGAAPTSARIPRSPSPRSASRRAATAGRTRSRPCRDAFQRCSPAGGKPFGGRGADRRSPPPAPDPRRGLGGREAGARVAVPGRALFRRDGFHRQARREPVAPGMVRPVVRRALPASPGVDAGLSPHASGRRPAVVSGPASAADHRSIRPDLGAGPPPARSTPTDRAGDADRAADAATLCPAAPSGRRRPCRSGMRRSQPRDLRPSSFDRSATATCMPPRLALHP